jgi:hypothetical protein
MDLRFRQLRWPCHHLTGAEEIQIPDPPVINDISRRSELLLKTSFNFYFVLLLLSIIHLCLNKPFFICYPTKIFNSTIKQIQRKEKENYLNISEGFTSYSVEVLFKCTWDFSWILRALLSLRIADFGTRRS